MIAFGLAMGFFPTTTNFGQLRRFEVKVRLKYFIILPDGSQRSVENDFISNRISF